MKSGLTLSNLTKRYTAGDLALDSVSMELKAGELLSVVGPSGCGKSTLLKLLSGLEEPTSGDMHLDGARLNDLAPKHRDISLMFQNYALFPHLNVRDNMAFGLIVRGLGKSEAHRKVEEVAKQMGIAPLLDRMPSEISGGERQRAALGRALLRRPKLFLFDEPLSSLDAALRSQLRVEIGRLHRELEASMLFVTHDQNEALTLGDRVAVLHQGRLQQIADADTLYREPANRFVAGFIGNPGMGFFEGHCEKDAGLWLFRHVDWDGPLTLPSSVVKAHAGLKPGPTVLGLRPEHLELHTASSSEAKGLSGAMLVGQIQVTERWGDFALHYLRSKTGSYAFRSRSNQVLGVGQTVHCHAVEAEIRLFEPASGRSLAL